MSPDPLIYRRGEGARAYLARLEALDLEHLPQWRRAWLTATIEEVREVVRNREAEEATDMSTDSTDLSRRQGESAHDYQARLEAINPAKLSMRQQMLLSAILHQLAKAIQESEGKGE